MHLNDTYAYEIGAGKLAHELHLHATSLYSKFLLLGMYINYNVYCIVRLDDCRYRQLVFSINNPA